MEPDKPIARRIRRNHRLNRKRKNQERLNEDGAGGGEEDLKRPPNSPPLHHMVAISLFRGNLHRVSDAPRRWALPPRAISLAHFKLLLRKRSLSRLSAATAAVVKAVEEETKKAKEEEAAAAAAPIVYSSDPQVSSIVPKKEEEWEEEEEGKDRQVAVESGNVASLELNPPGDFGNNGSAAAALDVKIEKGMTTASNRAKVPMNKEERKRELEEKLHVLNDKKHNLVQILKQILNAEEELKRHNMESSVLRAFIPTQAETLGEISSVARQPPKLSVEVNFGGDSSEELDGAANNNLQALQLSKLHNISPSAASLSRPPFGPLQHNTGTLASRISFPATGHGPSASTTSGTSPSCFATCGQQGHTSGPSPFALPHGFYTVSSSPSPAASSSGANSVFRDPRLSNS